MGRIMLEGVSDGEWSVFAEKVVMERDVLRKEVARLRALLGECEDDVRYAWINSMGAGRSVRADRLMRLKAALAEGKE